MNKSALILYFLPWILVLGACQAPTENENPELEFDLVSYQKNKCFGERCANVSFSYPKFDYSHPYAQQVNAHIDEQLKMYLQFGVFHDYESLDAAVSDFFRSFEQQEVSKRWSVKVEARVSYQTEKLLSIEFTNISFTGGNHPNEHLLFLNFDLDQGNLMIRNEIVLDREILLEKAEMSFRTHHNISQASSLEEDGRFFLEDDSLFLPFSIGYRERDLVLYYNHYEISPYDMGPTELIFPLKDLEGIVLIK